MSHNGIVGFGITKSSSRIHDYTAQCLQTQNFSYMFYGPEDEVEEIESFFKRKHKSILLKQIKKKNKWRLEGIDPKLSNMSAEDLKLWVEKFVRDNKFNTMRVQDIWLPFGGDPKFTRKNITISPELYLEKI